MQKLIGVGKELQTLRENKPVGAVQFGILFCINTMHLYQQEHYIFNKCVVNCVLFRDWIYELYRQLISPNIRNDFNLNANSIVDLLYIMENETTMTTSSVSRDW